MGREEQDEEREVLSSIFPDELECISETEIRIATQLEVGEVKDENEDEATPPKFYLQVHYTEAYPDEPPTLDLLPTPNALVNRWFSVAADKEELLASIKDVVEENLGMAMVFTIYSAVKDNAEQLIMDRQAAEQKGQEAKVLAAEAKENEKFHGTPVTPETFTTWRDEFMAELEAQRLKEEEELEASEKKKNRGKEVVVQMTGRQLWERGLAGKIEDDDDDGTLPADIRIDKLSVEA